jgi:hypothetical protein
MIAVNFRDEKPFIPYPIWNSIYCLGMGSVYRHKWRDPVYVACDYSLGVK